MRTRAAGGGGDVGAAAPQHHAALTGARRQPAGRGCVRPARETPPARGGGSHGGGGGGVSRHHAGLFHLTASGRKGAWVVARNTGVIAESGGTARWGVVGRRVSRPQPGREVRRGKGTICRMVVKKRLLGNASVVDSLNSMPHNACSAPWPSTPSLQCSISWALHCLNCCCPHHAGSNRPTSGGGGGGSGSGQAGDSGGEETGYEHARGSGGGSHGPGRC